MAQAARTYYASRANVAPQRGTRPDITVVPGSRASNPALAHVSARTVRAFKLIIVLTVALVLVCCARVMLSARTVEALQENEQLEAELVEVQDVEAQLEIQHSILTSPERIKKKAEDLGMVPAQDIEYLSIEYTGSSQSETDGAAASSEE